MTTIPATFPSSRVPDADFAKMADLFGGPGVLKRSVSGPIDAHDLILHGLPSRALQHLVTHLVVIDPSDAFETAFGMSERTFQRHKSDAARTLSAEHSARTWNFARILARASEVLGSQEEAEKWMIASAIGLDGRRPIDLLATPAGTELVQEFLDRLDYGLYS